MADARERHVVPAREGLAQLPCEDARAGDAEAALPGRDQQMQEILLHALEIELPGDDAGAGGRPPELGNLCQRPADGGVTSPFAQNRTTRPMHEEIAFPTVFETGFCNGNRQILRASGQPSTYFRLQKALISYSFCLTCHFEQTVR